MIRRLLFVGAVLSAAIAPALSQSVVDANLKVVGAVQGEYHVNINVPNVGWIAIMGVTPWGFVTASNSGYNECTESYLYTLPNCGGSAYWDARNCASIEDAHSVAIPLFVLPGNTIGLLKNAGNAAFYRARIDYPSRAATAIKPVSFAYISGNNLTCNSYNFPQTSLMGVKVLSTTVQFTPPFTLK